MPARIFRALIALFFVTTIAGASFFVSQKLSSSNSVSPNAPDSKPQAAAKAPLSKEDREELATSKAQQQNNKPVQTQSTPKPRDERDDEPRTQTGSTTVAPGSASQANTSQYTTPTATPFQTPLSGAGATTPGSSQTTSGSPIVAPGSSSQAQSSAGMAAATPAPTNTIAPTPAKDNFGSKETTAGQSYTNSTNNNCNDNQGFVSGTFCTPTGERRVVGGSEVAYQQYVQQNADRLATMTDKEILERAGVSCDPTVKNCKTVIEEAQSKVLAQNIILDTKNIEQISNHRLQLQALKDIADPSTCNDTCLKNKYGTAKPEAILAELKITDADTLKQSVEVRKNFNISQEPILYKTEIEKYLSTATDKQLATDYCKNEPNKTFCINNFDRKDLLANITDPKPYLQIKQDEINAAFFADPKNSLSDIAKQLCGGQKECLQYANFQNANSGPIRDYLLTSIKDENTRKIAQTNRLLALQSYIPLVATKNPVSVPGIDNETKREIVKLNEDVTHAFWVYVRSDENTRRQRNGVTSSQLAEEFDKMLKADPSLLAKNIADYNSNPKEYNIQFTNIDFSKEPNPIIASQINQVIKTQSISGLANNGKAVIFANADPIYKLQAMAQSCQDKSSILSVTECRSVNGMIKNISNINNPTSEELALIETFTETPLTKKFASSNNTQIYLQEVFSNIAGTNNLLSTFQSNIVDINNAAVGNKKISDAKKAAELEDLNNQLANNALKYGGSQGMGGMAPVFVSDSYNGDKKLTQEQLDEIANQYLERQLVVETYKRGGGIGGTLAAAGAATALCSGLGAGAIACGAVGGAAGVISTWIPILGTATAEEIEAERKAIADFVGNDAAASFIQALYSNQGALGDEGLGRSITTKDNAFATLDSIQTIIQSNGATLDQINNDPSIMAQIALQPFLNNQWEALQNENETQAWVNAAVAPVVGAISGGVASSIMGQATAHSAPTLSQIFKDVAYDTALWAGGAVINDLQTQVQFDQTTTYIDTQAEIDLIACQRLDGIGSCENESIAVTDETEQARLDNRLQAAVSDFVIQAGQTSFSLAGQLNNYIKNNNIEIKNSPAPATQANTNTAPLLSSGTDDAITAIARNYTESKADITTTVNELVGVDAIDKKIALLTLENTSYKDYVTDPTRENLTKLVQDIKDGSANPAFGGNDTAAASLLEAIQKLHNKVQDIGLDQPKVENLLAVVKTELGIETNTTPTKPTANEATLVDPQKEAIQRLINQRARQDRNLSIDELNTLFEDIAITEGIINQIHALQENLEFLNATARVARTISESESAKVNLLKSKSPTENFEEAAQKIIFDLTSELAQNLASTIPKQPSADTSTQKASTPPAKPSSEQIKIILELQAEFPGKIITIDDIQSRINNINDQELANISVFIESIDFIDAAQRIQDLVNRQNRLLETANKNLIADSVSVFGSNFEEQRRAAIENATLALAGSPSSPDAPKTPKRNYKPSETDSPPNIIDNRPSDVRIERGGTTEYWGIDTFSGSTRGTKKDSFSNLVPRYLYEGEVANQRIAILEENLEAIKYVKGQNEKDNLVDSLILTKENTISKRLGIALEDLHFLSNEDLKLVMDSYHRLTDGNLEIVRINQDGSVTYKDRTTNSEFTLSNKWPDTRLLNQIFANQKQPIAGQDVTQAFYQYYRNNQGKIPVIVYENITPVSSNNQFNFNGEKYFDINTREYTNQESPYTRPVIDTQGNVSNDFFFESPTNLIKERTSFLREYNAVNATPENIARQMATYTKDNLIELASNKVVSIEEANNYLSSVGDDPITDKEIASYIQKNKVDQTPPTPGSSIPQTPKDLTPPPSKNNGVKIKIIEVIEGFFPIPNTKSNTFKDLYINIKNDVAATYPQSRFKENFVDPFNNARTSIKKRASELLKIFSIEKIPEQIKTPTAAPAPTKTTQIDFSKDLTVDEIRQIVPDFGGNLTDEDIKAINFQLKYYTIGGNDTDIFFVPQYGSDRGVTDLHPLLKTLLQNARMEKIGVANGAIPGNRFANIAEAYLNKKNTSQQGKTPVITESRSKAATDLGVVPSRGFFITTITAGFSSIFGLIFQAIKGNPTTFTIPTPTPTISISPTITITPTITSQPTITISPTPTLFTPSATPTEPKASFIFPNVQQLSPDQMSEFALTAKKVGEMIISCQNQGITKDQALYDCLCAQTENKCSTKGGIEDRMADALSVRAGGTEPLECVDLLYSIEIIRNNPIGSGCLVDSIKANDMVPSECNGAGNMNSYFCPQSVVEQNGFVEGDVVVWQDYDTGHTEICTQTSADGCEMIGANLNKDGVTAFRPVSKSSSFAGVWRGPGEKTAGCSFQ